MKLLLISVEFPPGPGGMGTLAYQLANGLSELDWHVVVATVQAHVPIIEIKKFNSTQPFPIIWLKYKGCSIIEGVYRLIKIIQSCLIDRPEIILAIGRQAAWIASIVARLFKVPLVVVGIGSEFLIKNWFDQKLTRWAFESAQIVIPISHFALNLANMRKIRLSQVYVIPCGADEQLYKPNINSEGLRNKLELNNNKIVLTVGQLSERKAQDIVIRALPEILHRFPNCIYLMAGLPTQRVELEYLADKLGIRDQIMFLGVVKQEELPIIYNLCDVFVLVSRQTNRGDVEGFGIVVVEAALCGKPSIVSNNSGLVEAVIPNETALVIDPEDHHATAQTILQLLTDKELCQKMGDSAYHHAINNSTWKKRVQEYHYILEGLL